MSLPDWRDEIDTWPKGYRAQWRELVSQFRTGDARQKSRAERNAYLIVRSIMKRGS